MKKAVAVLLVLAILAAAAYFLIPKLIEGHKQVPVPPVGETVGETEPGVRMPEFTSIPNASGEDAKPESPETRGSVAAETPAQPAEAKPAEVPAQPATEPSSAPVPPERETLVLTEEETVRLEQGPVGEPEIIEEVTAEAAVMEEPMSGDAAIEEDRMVKLGFIEDLAVYIVNNYHPVRDAGTDNGQGTLAVSFSSLNRRYGVRPTGFAHQATGMRAIRREILGYVMHPLVLRGLYNLYANHCVDMLQWAAENTEKVLPGPDGKPQKTMLTPKETVELFRLSADALDRFAWGLSTIADSPEIMAMTRAYLNAEVEVMDMNQVVQNALAEHADKATVSGAGLRLKESIQTREDAKEKLLAAIRATCGEHCASLDNSELLSMAQWVHRRRPGSPTGNRVGARSVLTAADLMRDMADRLLARAGQISE